MSTNETKPSALDQIADFVKVIGPPQQQFPVTIRGVTKSFWFCRPPFIIMDEIRLSGFGEDGKFNAQKFKGQNARVLAHTLINEDGTPVADFATISMWDPLIVDALAEVSNKFNNFTGEAAAEAGKESGKTPDAASS